MNRAVSSAISQPGPRQQSLSRPRLGPTENSDGSGRTPNQLLGGCSLTPF
jgi:hypothetical protein